MKQLVVLAQDIDRFFEERGWSGCIIGGIAALRWGEVRATYDVDATIYTGFDDDGRYAREILERFEPRIDDAVGFALANRVVLARSPDGVGIDISLGGLAFEEEMVARASRAELAPGVFVRTASAEDLIVMKAFADRPRDWTDIGGIIVRQGPALDWEAIRERLRPLAELKEAPEIMRKLESARIDVEES